jgi:hypothetical protein
MYLTDFQNGCTMLALKVGVVMFGTNQKPSVEPQSGQLFNVLRKFSISSRFNPIPDSCNSDVSFML